MTEQYVTPSDMPHDAGHRTLPASGAASCAAPVPPPRGFHRSEYERRCQAVQRRMIAAGIDVLWLSTEADIRYLTGFLTQFWQSPTRPWYLLLAQTGQPVAVIPAIGEPCMRRTWLDDIRTWSSPHVDDDGVSLLSDTVMELVGEAATIGLPMGPETQLRCPMEDYARIRQRLGSLQWLDATDVIRSVRQVKSPAEIDKLRYICSVASRTFADVPDFVKIGMSEIELFRAFRIACLNNGADNVDYLVGAARADGYDDIISPPSEHRLTDGDILILDSGCTYDGYFADFDRNYAIQRVNAETAAAHHRTWDATEAGLAQIRAGRTCAEVFAAMQKVLAIEINVNAGVGRLGHGLGSQLTETPSITAFDDTVLVSGMVMTLEPGYCYAPNKIMVHEENVVITDNGYELLSTRAARDIPIIK